MIKRFFLIFFSSLCLHSFAQETFPVNGVVTEFEPIYAFINAHIVSPDKEIVNGILLIQGNKILEADTVVQIPTGAIVKDLKGDYIYASFIDLNTQYGLPKTAEREHSNRPQYTSKKEGAFHWNQAIHPEIIAANNFSNNKKAKDFRSIGFGTVLTHHKDGIARGAGCLVLLSEEKEHQNILIKNAAAHYSFSKGNSSQKYPTSLMGSIALLRQTYLDAEWYSQGVEDINYSFEAFNSQQDLPQIFQVKDAFDISRIYKIADEFEVDYIIIGNGDEYKQLDIIKQTDFSFILPLNFPESYEVSNPEEAENITLEQLKHWESAPFNPLILVKNDIAFSFTSSGNKNPKDFLKNLRKAIKKGLSKKDALAALTTIPSQQLNAENLIGTIEKDKYANFIICSKDIFEDGIIYENWVAGKKYVVNKKQEFDIRGYYTLNSDEFENELVAIKGSKTKPKTTIYLLDSLSLPTSFEGNTISINTKNGNFRSVGIFSDGKIKGRYQDENGIFHHFLMVRDSIFEEKEKELKVETDSIIPKIY